MKKYKNSRASRARKATVPVSPQIKGWRVALVRSGFVAFGLIILARLVHIQIWDHAQYTDLASEQYDKLQLVRGNRGLIYDRNQVELVLNKLTFDIGANRRLIENRDKTSGTLAQVLKKSKNAIKRELAGKDGFVFLQKGVEPEVALPILSMRLPGITVDEVHERTYPFRERLAAVLGFLGDDGNVLTGLESYYDDYLTCRNGEVRLLRDAFGNAIRPDNYTQRMQSGKHIVLTIDNVIQTIAEEELRLTVERYRAKGGSVIVTNPTTGEILAMAALPGYDANYASGFPTYTHKITPITDIYEPGSTFKIVALAALIEGTDKQLNDLVFCENGAYRIFGEIIHDTEKHDWLTLRDAFVKSSNIGVAKMAFEIKKDGLYLMARSFGFGNVTGVGLPGEVPGILKNPRHWSKFSVAAISYGHGVAVTPLQMAMAFGAVANGGRLMKPIIVKEILSSDHLTLESSEPQVIRQAIDQKTAHTMIDVLEKVVESGTGSEAKIENLRIAGKTGTAQKPLTDARGYSRSSYMSSFAGFYPSQDARFLIHVVIDEPSPQYYGGKVAAPTFRRILKRILSFQTWPELTNRTPQEIERQPQQIERPLKKIHSEDLIPLIGKRRDAAIRILQSWGLVPNITNDGPVLKKARLMTSTQGRQSVVLLTFADYPKDSTQVIVPDVRNLPVRQAVSELSKRRLNVRIFGNGIVASQDPPPGTKLIVGQTCALTGTTPTLISFIPERNGSQLRRN